MSRKKYYMILDVETTNSTEDALVYDLGFVVCDRQGKIYSANSFIVSDIFFREKELMKSAYYAEKIPQYLKEIDEKKFKIKTFYEARLKIFEALRKWNIKEVYAYNALFDYRALNTTQRWLTKSRYRYFLPYDTKICCIWNMACQVICTQTKYIKFCLKNNLISESGNIKTNAETVYSYLTKNPTFCESHTGLADVLIETQIFAHCIKQHKKMDRSINRLCWRIPQPKAKEIKSKMGN